MKSCFLLVLLIQRHSISDVENRDVPCQVWERYANISESQYDALALKHPLLVEAKIIISAMKVLVRRVSGSYREKQKDPTEILTTLHTLGGEFISILKEFASSVEIDYSYTTGDEAVIWVHRESEA